MILQLLLALAAEPVLVAEATVRDVSASTLVGGTCLAPVTYASVRISWAFTGLTADYRVQLYKNGIAVPGFTGGTSYDESVDGYVEGGSFHRFTSAWTYRVDVIRIVDNAVVSTASSPVWRKQYGTCSVDL